MAGIDFDHRLFSSFGADDYTLTRKLLPGADKISDAEIDCGYEQRNYEQIYYRHDPPPFRSLFRWRTCPPSHSQIAASEFKSSADKFAG